MSQNSCNVFIGTPWLGFWSTRKTFCWVCTWHRVSRPCYNGQGCILFRYCCQNCWFFWDITITTYFCIVVQYWIILYFFVTTIADTGHSFDALLLYGHEFSLTIFDILVFSFVDLLVQDYLIAAIITYFVGKVCI